MPPRDVKQAVLECSGPVEIGRQKRASENLYLPYVLEDGRSRLVMAKATEDNVDRRHALIELLADDRVRITNLSHVQPIYFAAVGSCGCNRPPLVGCNPAARCWPRWPERPWPLAP